MKTVKLFLFSFIALLLVPSVFALVDVTYNFNQATAEVAAYNCLDAGCNTVGAFSGSFPSGTSTTSGQLTIQYPSTLTSDFGYAIFYVSPGQLPVEGWATWHSFGDQNVFTTNVNTNFEQAEDCKSTIDSFSVTNDLQANIPVVVDVSASLDGTTHSAFYLTNNQIGFVPPQYAADYYSVDTTVRLQIFDESGVLVNEQTQDLVLFADDDEVVQFTWTPTDDGEYTAVISTEVTDDQCSSTIDQSSMKAFNVLPDTPEDQCYTLLNDLALDDPYPELGQQVVASYNKISNYADDAGTLTPTATAVSYQVFGPSGLVFDDETVLAPNPDAVTPTMQGFGWTPDEEGMHTVVVQGSGFGSLCSGAEDNFEETVVLNIYVDSLPTFDVTFQIVDSLSGAPVVGATVVFDGVTGMTDASGIAGFTNVAPDVYDYTITRTGYQNLDGSVTVVDSDVTLLLPMDPTSIPGLHDAFFVITDAVTGVAVPNAQVVAGGQAAFSNADGVAVVNGLSDGSYTYTVQHAGYMVATGGFVVAGDDVIVPVVLIPAPTGTFSVTVQVIDADTGDEISGAFVAVDGLAGITDNNGFITLTGFVPGTYGMQVSSPGFTTFTGTVTIIDSDVFLVVALAAPDEAEEENPEMELFISTIRIPDAFDAAPGQWVEVTLQFRNSGDFSIEDLKATVVSQELGLRAVVGPEDLGIGQRLTKRLMLELPPDVQYGNYPVRITLSSDKFKRVVYRDIDVWT